MAELPRRDALCPHGILRAAINLGNAVLANRTTNGEPAGPTVDLTREIARRLGIQASLIPFDAAGKVVESTGDDLWDIAFLAIDERRAEDIAYTAPYVEIEGVFVVPPQSAITSPDELNAADKRIGVGKGAAYDLHLTRNFANAKLERYPTSADVFPAIARDSLDAGAGIRQPAEAFVATAAGFRLIDKPFMKIRQAIAVPRRNATAIPWLQSQIDTMLASGFVADALVAAGQDPQLAILPSFKF